MRKERKILGLDLGTNSVGWALISRTDSKKGRILGLGSRVFEAGMDGDMSNGTQVSRNAGRREKRMLRRQHDRRARRMQEILGVLQGAGLMPVSDNMALAIREIDRKALARLKVKTDIQHLAHVVPYKLRAEALSYRLDDFELGRALYHLSQKRGFLSNRKTAISEDDEDLGKVKTGISELARRMEAADARTLGEYFSFVDPEEERIRGHYTGRSMYIDEFKKILAAQKEFGNVAITETFERTLYRAVFHQRPLKSCRNLIGLCPYEAGRKRAPWYHPAAQRFRVLQSVGNLRLVFKDGETRELSAEERTVLLAELSEKASVSVASVKGLLGLKKGSCAFSIEEGGEKTLPGNAVNARFMAVFGRDRWLGMSPAEQLEAILDVNSYTSEEGLAKRGRTRWGLDDAAAEAFADLKVPPDYAGLSVKAMEKLLPRMEAGMPYMTAVKEIYPETFTCDKVYDALPAVKDFIKDLRNPAVERTLTQLRHIINPIIKRFGKPDEIHVELARDIKRSAKDKKNITKKMREQEARRANAAEALRIQLGIEEPNRRDIEKYMLWLECRQICPYSGRQIPLTNLFGDQSEFDIEHIIPYSVSLDDSFANKTLCEVRLNREQKRNRSPFQAFAEHGELYTAMLERVDRFDSLLRPEKLRRFKLEDLGEFSDFAARQLTDTSYAAKLAQGYLAALYGGTSDATSVRRIFAVSGGITAIVRNYYRMNRVLGEGDRKTRSDHRHHAVDAVVLALVSSATVQSVSETAAEYALRSTRLMYQGDSEPWDGFQNELRRAVGDIKVTHAASRKIRGELHKEGLYGIVDGTEGLVSYTKRLEDVSAGDLENITDPVVRRIVTDKFTELGILETVKKKNRAGAEAEKWTVNEKKQALMGRPENLPRMVRKDGTPGPVIRSVRCRKNQEVTRIGSADHPRAVITGNNHHIEILETKDKKGGVKWEGICVSLLEAYRRKRAKEPVVQRDHGPEKNFVFSLAGGDIIQAKLEGSEEPELYVVRAVPQSLQICFVALHHAMKKDDLKKAGEFKSKLIDPLRQTGARKVTLTPFGEIRYAND